MDSLKSLLTTALLGIVIHKQVHHGIVQILSTLTLVHVLFLNLSSDDGELADDRIRDTFLIFPENSTLFPFPENSTLFPLNMLTPVLLWIYNCPKIWTSPL